MEELINKLQTALSEAFPGALLRFEHESASAPIEAEIVWEGFEGVEQIDRQRRLREVLRNALSPDERSDLSIILAFTPVEIAVMEEG